MKFSVYIFSLAIITVFFIIFRRGHKNWEPLEMDDENSESPCQEMGLVEMKEHLFRQIEMTVIQSATEDGDVGSALLVLQEILPFDIQALQRSEMVPTSEVLKNIHSTLDYLSMNRLRSYQSNLACGKKDTPNDPGYMLLAYGVARNLYDSTDIFLLRLGSKKEIETFAASWNQESLEAAIHTMFAPKEVLHTSVVSSEELTSIHA